MHLYLSDTEWVIVVLAAIYLFESFFGVRREAVCYASLLRSFRVLPSPAVMGNLRTKLMVGNPWPLARTFVCEPWPFAISPQGIVLNESIGQPTDACSRFVTFETIAAGLTIVEKELRTEVGPIACCSSPDQTKRLAEMLAQVAGTIEEQRGNVIGKHLDRWTDRTAAAERLTEITKLSDALRGSAVMLFVLAFIMGPAVYFYPGRVPVLSIALYFAMAFTVWMMTVWDYGHCRKKLLGEKFGVRFRHTGMLLVSPASAMRCGEALFRDSLSGYHPLTAATVLCTKDRLNAQARAALLALEYPVPTETPSEPEAQRADAWFRKKLLKRLRGMLGEFEIDVTALLQPAEPLADSRSYCPRCHNQYVLAEGTCADCGGVVLVAYEVDNKPASNVTYSTPSGLPDGEGD